MSDTPNDNTLQLPPQAKLLICDMTDTDAREQFRLMEMCPQYRLVLWDIDQYLRSNVKHGDDEAYATACQRVRDELYRLMAHYGVSIDD